MSRLPVLVLIALLFPVELLAQHRIMISGARSAPPASPSAPFAGSRTSIGITGPFRFHHQFRQGPFYPYGLYPGYFGDYGFGYDSYEPPPPAPQPAPPPAPAAQIKQEPLPTPILLELQGNQWVKVENFTAGAAQAPTAVATTRAAVKEIPPAILVFRDGHSEELTSYSIIGPVIYTKSNYWVNGSWTRTIQIADLDLPATMKQNEQRGVKFDLPSGPDEVFIRP